MAIAVAGLRLLPFTGRMTALFVSLLASLPAMIHSPLDLAAPVWPCPPNHWLGLFENAGLHVRFSFEVLLSPGYMLTLIG